LRRVNSGGIGTVHLLAGDGGAHKVGEDVKKSERGFTELRKLEEGFSSDPRKW
jgi:hypothetical protein